MIRNAVTRRGKRSGRAVTIGQLRSNASILAIAVLISLGTIALVAYLHFEDHVSAYLLISDPAPYVGMPWYFDPVSHAGILLWVAAASVCAFAAAVLRGSGDEGRRRISRLLLVLSTATLWMALDDLLLIHEELGELIFGLDARHTGEAVVFGAFALLMLACFIYFRATIAQTEVLLLWSELISLGASLMIDTDLQLDMGGNNIFLDALLSTSWGGPAVDIIEDVLKLNGGILLFAYLFRTGHRAIRDEMAPATISSSDRRQQEPQSKRRRKPERR